MDKIETRAVSRGNTDIVSRYRMGGQRAVSSMEKQNKRGTAGSLEQ
jgi:hypothetical protein